MAKKEKPKKEEKPAAAPAEGADGEAPAKKKLAGKTLILFIVLPAVLILGGGGAAAYFLLAKPKPEAHAEADAHGKKDAKDKKKKDDHKKDAKGDKHGKGKDGEGASVSVVEGDGVYFMKLPDMLVNVSTGEGKPAFLKLRLTIEAPDEEVVAALEPELPRVTDQFQAFLRELRVDDLSGSAGAYRMRLELLRRVNLAIAPAQANAVLIEEMLVQ
jgi:flagellar FliL protein